MNKKKMKNILVRLFASRRKRSLTFLMSVVVFATTYALILPAITLTRDRQELNCPYVVHQHTDACYIEEPVYDAEGNQTGTKKVLVCGRADYVAHQHEDSCYQDGKLVCQLPEIKAHVHEKDCYKTEKVLSCGLEETDGHIHTDSCYTDTETLVCTTPEHTHTDACYSDVVVSTEQQLICGYEEGEEISAAVWSEPEYSEAVIDPETGEVLEEAQLIRDAEIIQDAVVHHHDDSCYETIEQTERQLTCGMEEHTHDASCYHVDRKLTCGLAEGEAHMHSASCYSEQQVLTCTEYQELHTHTMDCYEKGPKGESPEKMGWAWYEEDENGNKIVVGDYTHRICGKTELLEHQHEQTCFTANVLKDQTADETQTETTDETEEITYTETDINVASAAFNKEVPVEGADYHLMVSAGAECGIPKDAVFKAVAISEDTEDFDTYAEQALDAVAQMQQTGSASDCRMIGLFDLSIYDAEGNEIQPDAPLSVTVVRPEMKEDVTGDLYAVHFPGTGLSEDGTVVSSDKASDPAEAEVINAEKDGENVSFEAESFSVYAIVNAPEPKTEALSVNGLDEIMENQEYFLSIVRSGTNYMTSTRTLNNGTYELKGDTNKTAGEKWFFELLEDGKVNIYFLDSEDTKQYLNVDTARNISFSETPQPLNIESTTNADGTFYVYKVINNKNYALSVRGNRNFFFENRNNGANANERVVLTKYLKDLYELDGKSFGIAYNDNSALAAALMAESKGNNLSGLDLLIRTDILNNNSNLLVAEDSDAQEWVFEAIELDQYYIKTTVEGTEKYLRINGTKVTLVDDKNSASVITAEPGTGANKGKWHFKAGSYSLNYAGNTAQSFNAANNDNPTTWLNLIEKSTLSEDDFTYYSARKISASDDLLGANAEEKAKVIVYTRVWNSDTSRYEYYAVDHDGTLVRVYDSGDKINWVGNQVNSALWEFTEYTNADGTPNNYYELENTAYSSTFLAPQSNGVIANQPVGVNMEGRQEGFDYTNILAWDQAAYAYSGLKVEGGKVVSCPKDEADDFYFAVIVPPVEEADPVTTVKTVDNNEYGISMKMIDFNNKITGGRDSVQTAYLGSREWDVAHAYEAETGLVSTNLTGGYPTITAHTPKNGESLSGLFDNMTPANNLFIQSVYNESGYFEYDSTQNFAHYNTDGDKAGNFTVYNQIGAIGTSTGPTRTHGQFMPYNDISAENGYAHDNQGNVIRNITNIRSQELSDTDPRKGEPLYSIPQKDADYYFGMELSASFTQTPDGLDNWGHDIIFEFTGDDDFWFYVDDELVLDLGGVHSAIGGSVNFRTGEVVCNGVTTSLYDIFRTHYEDRGMSGDDITRKLNEIFENKDGNYIFKDYTNHTMKMFYMERGAGASNLKMRFNLASVQPGTVELSKKLAGTENTSNKLIQYPYQIWYQMPVYETENEEFVYDENGEKVIAFYEDPVQLVQGATASAAAAVLYKGTKTLVPFKENLNIDGKDYRNVFLLKAGQTAVIKLPDKNCKYEIIECGVDTEVYEQVKVNGTEITGKLYENTDSGTEASTDDHRKDFGIDYETTISRPRAEYSNKVAPGVMRTLSFEKLVYDAEGHPLSPEDTAKVSAKFNFRLYLGNEFADENNLSLANMYSYYVKDPGGSYCRWNAADQRFDPLDITEFEGTGGLEKYLSVASSAEKSAVVFTTSLNGSIANIPAGYTVEVRDLIVGTKYKVEEPDREIPKGYTRCDGDGYVRTDLSEGSVVYYTDNGTYGHHPAANNKITAEPVSDTIVSRSESPRIEVRNQQGWGLTAVKEWTDKDFMIHDPIYLAVYLDENGDGTPDSLIDGTVRKLDSDETEIYWFFPDLKINGEPKSFKNFIVREVELTGKPVVDENGVVTGGYTAIDPIDEGQKISVDGKTFSGSDRTEDYTVNYDPGDSTGHNENIRTDVVKNSRPGIQIYKTDWSGNNFLAGAEFTLKDSEGKDVGSASYTSGSNGLVTTAYLNEGTFTLDEIKTPFGYAALDEPIIITVTTTVPDSYDLTVPAGTTTYYIKLSGPADFYTTAPATNKDMARITVKNRTVQELKVTKVGVDGSTRTPLGGVHFALYEQVKDSEGKVRPAYNPKAGYEDLVTTEEGILSDITMSVGAGTYYLREKAAPSGYKKLAEDLCFTIGKNGTVTINNAGYSSWLTKDTSVSGTISYQISIENTPLGITVRKTDETGNALPGSKFVLCKKTDAGSFEGYTGNGLGEGGLIDLTDKTEMTFTGMPSGLYKLSETNAPSGYIIQTKDIYFSVSDGALTLTDENCAAKTYSSVALKDDNTTIAVANTPGAPLPNTGGPGTRHYILWGMMLLGIAAAGFLFKRRIS